MPNNEGKTVAIWLLVFLIAGVILGSFLNWQGTALVGGIVFALLEGLGCMLLFGGGGDGDEMFVVLLGGCGFIFLIGLGAGYFFSRPDLVAGVLGPYFK